MSAKMQKLKLPFKRFVSLGLSVVFLFFSVYIPDIAYAKIADSNVIDLSGGINISKDNGNIKDIYNGKNGKLIIHIQDAHVNYEGQKNLASILKNLIEKHGIDLVLAEGGSGSLNISLLRHFATEERRERVADRYLKKGRIAGEEYLDIVSNPSFKFDIYGIEDKRLYESHLNQFLKIDKFTEKANDFITSLNRALNILKEKLYSKELKQFERKKLNYDKEKLDLVSYCKYLRRKAKDYKEYNQIDSLLKTHKLERYIDFGKVNTERDEFISFLSKKLPKDKLNILLKKSVDFKSGLIPPSNYYAYIKDLGREVGIDILDYPNLNTYTYYIRLFEDIDSEGLFDEIASLEDLVRERLSKNDIQRKLGRVTEDLKIIKNFVNLRLLPDDLKEYQSRKSDFNLKGHSKFINRLAKLQKLPEAFVYYTPVIDRNLRKLERFYDIAKKRDKAFFKNTLKVMKEKNKNRAVLIAGGFHTKHLMPLFKDEGYSYIVVSPKIIHKTDLALYRSLLKADSLRIRAVVDRLPTFETLAKDIMGPEVKISPAQAVQLLEDLEASLPEGLRAALDNVRFITEVENRRVVRIVAMEGDRVFGEYLIETGEWSLSFNQGLEEISESYGPSSAECEVTRIIRDLLNHGRLRKAGASLNDIYIVKANDPQGVMSVWPVRYVNDPSSLAVDYYIARPFIENFARFYRKNKDEAMEFLRFALEFHENIHVLPIDERGIQRPYAAIDDPDIDTARIAEFLEMCNISERNFPGLDIENSKYTTKDGGTYEIDTREILTWLTGWSNNSDLARGIALYMLYRFAVVEGITNEAKFVRAIREFIERPRGNRYAEVDHNFFWLSSRFYRETYKNVLKHAKALLGAYNETHEAARPSIGRATEKRIKVDLTPSLKARGIPRRAAAMAPQERPRGAEVPIGMEGNYKKLLILGHNGSVDSRIAAIDKDREKKICKGFKAVIRRYNRMARSNLEMEELLRGRYDVHKTAIYGEVERGAGEEVSPSEDESSWVGLCEDCLESPVTALFLIRHQRDRIAGCSQREIAARDIRFLSLLRAKQRDEIRKGLGDLHANDAVEYIDKLLYIIGKFGKKDIDIDKTFRLLKRGDISDLKEYALDAVCLDPGLSNHLATGEAIAYLKYHLTTRLALSEMEPLLPGIVTLFIPKLLIRVINWSRHVLWKPRFIPGFSEPLSKKVNKMMAQRIPIILQFIIHRGLNVDHEDLFSLIVDLRGKIEGEDVDGEDVDGQGKTIAAHLIDTLKERYLDDDGEELSERIRTRKLPGGTDNRVFSILAYLYGVIGDEENARRYREKAQKETVPTTPQDREARRSPGSTSSSMAPEDRSGGMDDARVLSRSTIIEKARDNPSPNRAHLLKRLHAFIESEIPLEHERADLRRRLREARTSGIEFDISQRCDVPIVKDGRKYWIDEYFLGVELLKLTPDHKDYARVNILREEITHKMAHSARDIDTRTFEGLQELFMDETYATMRELEVEIQIGKEGRGAMLAELEKWAASYDVNLDNKIGSETIILADSIASDASLWSRYGGFSVDGIGEVGNRVLRLFKEYIRLREELSTEDRGLLYERIHTERERPLIRALDETRRKNLIEFLFDITGRDAGLIDESKLDASGLTEENIRRIHRTFIEDGVTILDQGGLLRGLDITNSMKLVNLLCLSAALDEDRAELVQLKNGVKVDYVREVIERLPETEVLAIHAEELGEDTKQTIRELVTTHRKFAVAESVKLDYENATSEGIKVGGLTSRDLEVQASLIDSEAVRERIKGSADAGFLSWTRTVSANTGNIDVITEDLKGYRDIIFLGAPALAGAVVDSQGIELEGRRMHFVNNLEGKRFQAMERLPDFSWDDTCVVVVSQGIGDSIQKENLKFLKEKVGDKIAVVADFGNPLLEEASEGLSLNTTNIKDNENVVNFSGMALALAMSLAGLDYRGFIARVEEVINNSTKGPFALSSSAPGKFAAVVRGLGLKENHKHKLVTTTMMWSYDKAAQDVIDAVTLSSNQRLARLRTYFGSNAPQANHCDSQLAMGENGILVALISPNEWPTSHVIPSTAKQRWAQYTDAEAMDTSRRGAETELTRFSDHNIGITFQAGLEGLADLVGMIQVASEIDYAVAVETGEKIAGADQTLRIANEFDRKCGKALGSRRTRDRAPPGMTTIDLSGLRDVLDKDEFSNALTAVTESNLTVRHSHHVKGKHIHLDEPAQAVVKEETKDALDLIELAAQGKKNLITFGIGAQHHNFRFGIGPLRGFYHNELSDKRLLFCGHTLDPSVMQDTIKEIDRDPYGTWLTYWSYSGETAESDNAFNIALEHLIGKAKKLKLDEEAAKRRLAKEAELIRRDKDEFISEMERLADEHGLTLAEYEFVRERVLIVTGKSGNLAKRTKKWGFRKAASPLSSGRHAIFTLTLYMMKALGMDTEEFIEGGQAYVENMFLTEEEVEEIKTASPLIQFELMLRRDPAFLAGGLMGYIGRHKGRFRVKFIDLSQRLAAAGKWREGHLFDEGLGKSHIPTVAESLETQDLINLLPALANDRESIVVLSHDTDPNDPLAIQKRALLEASKAFLREHRIPFVVLGARFNERAHAAHMLAMMQLNLGYGCTIADAPHGYSNDDHPYDQPKCGEFRKAVDVACDRDRGRKPTGIDDVIEQFDLHDDPQLIGVATNAMVIGQGFFDILKGKEAIKFWGRPNAQADRLARSAGEEMIKAIERGDIPKDSVHSMITIHPITKEPIIDRNISPNGKFVIWVFPVDDSIEGFNPLSPAGNPGSMIVISEIGQGEKLAEHSLRKENTRMIIEFVYGPSDEQGVMACCEGEVYSYIKANGVLVPRILGGGSHQTKMPEKRGTYAFNISDTQADLPPTVAAVWNQARSAEMRSRDFRSPVGNIAKLIRGGTTECTTNLLEAVVHSMFAKAMYGEAIIIDRNGNFYDGTELSVKIADVEAGNSAAYQKVVFTAGDSEWMGDLRKALETAVKEGRADDNRPRRLPDPLWVPDGPIINPLELPTFPESLGETKIDPDLIRLADRWAKLGVKLGLVEYKKRSTLAPSGTYNINLETQFVADMIFDKKYHELFEEFIDLLFASISEERDVTFYTRDGKYVSFLDPVDGVKNLLQGFVTGNIEAFTLRDGSGGISMFLLQGSHILIFEDGQNTYCSMWDGKDFRVMYKYEFGEPVPWAISNIAVGGAEGEYESKHEVINPEALALVDDLVTKEGFHSDNGTGMLIDTARVLERSRLRIFDRRLVPTAENLGRYKTVPIEQPVKGGLLRSGGFMYLHMDSGKPDPEIVDLGGKMRLTELVAQTKMLDRIAGLGWHFGTNKSSDRIVVAYNDPNIPGLAYPCYLGVDDYVLKRVNELMWKQYVERGFASQRQADLPFEKYDVAQDPDYLDAAYAGNDQDLDGDLREKLEKLKLQEKGLAGRVYYLRKNPHVGMVVFKEPEGRRSYPVHGRVEFLDVEAIFSPIDQGITPGSPEGPRAIRRPGSRSSSMAPEDRSGGEAHPLLSEIISQLRQRQLEVTGVTHKWVGPRVNQTVDVTIRGTHQGGETVIELKIIGASRNIVIEITPADGRKITLDSIHTELEEFIPDVVKALLVYPEVEEVVQDLCRDNPQIQFALKTHGVSLDVSEDRSEPPPIILRIEAQEAKGITDVVNMDGDSRNTLLARAGICQEARETSNLLDIPGAGEAVDAVCEKWGDLRRSTKGGRGYEPARIVGINIHAIVGRGLKDGAGIIYLGQSRNKTSEGPIISGEIVLEGIIIVEDQSILTEDVVRYIVAQILGDEVADLWKVRLSQGKITIEPAAHSANTGRARREEEDKKARRNPGSKPSSLAPGDTSGERPTPFSKEFLIETLNSMAEEGGAYQWATDLTPAERRELAHKLFTCVEREKWIEVLMEYLSGRGRTITQPQPAEAAEAVDKMREGSSMGGLKPAGTADTGEEGELKTIILVVGKDDFRRQIVPSLREKGYTVLEAGSAGKARNINERMLTTEGRYPDLAICDADMHKRWFRIFGVTDLPRLLEKVPFILISDKRMSIIDPDRFIEEVENRLRLARKERELYPIEDIMKGVNEVRAQVQEYIEQLRKAIGLARVAKDSIEKKKNTLFDVADTMRAQEVIAREKQRIDLELRINLAINLLRSLEGMLRKIDERVNADINRASGNRVKLYLSTLEMYNQALGELHNILAEADSEEESSAMPPYAYACFKLAEIPHVSESPIKAVLFDIALERDLPGLISLQTALEREDYKICFGTDKAAGVAREACLFISDSQEKVKEAEEAGMGATHLFDPENALEDVIDIAKLLSVIKLEINTLGSEAWRARVRAASNLGEIGAACAVEALIGVLGKVDEDVRVRRAAALALGKIGDRRAIGPLTEVLIEGETRDNQRDAAEALSMIANVMPEEDAALYEQGLSQEQQKPDSPSYLGELTASDIAVLVPLFTTIKETERVGPLLRVYLEAKEIFSTEEPEETAAAIRRIISQFQGGPKPEGTPDEGEESGIPDGPSGVPKPIELTGRDAGIVIYKGGNRIVSEKMTDELLRLFHEVFPREERVRFVLPSEIRGVNNNGFWDGIKDKSHCIIEWLNLMTLKGYAGQELLNEIIKTANLDSDTRATTILFLPQSIIDEMWTEYISQLWEYATIIPYQDLDGERAIFAEPLIGCGEVLRNIRNIKEGDPNADTGVYEKLFGHLHDAVTGKEQKFNIRILKSIGTDSFNLSDFLREIGFRFPKAGPVRDQIQENQRSAFMAAIAL